MTFEEWLTISYARGTPSRNVTPGYDPYQIPGQGDILSQIGKLVHSSGRRLFGGPGELTPKGPEKGSGNIPLPPPNIDELRYPKLGMPPPRPVTYPFGQPLPGERPALSMPNAGNIWSAFRNSLGANRQNYTAPPYQYQQPLVGVPYTGIPMPMPPIRKEIQMPIGEPRSSEEEPLPAKDPVYTQAWEGIPPLLRRPEDDF